MARTQAFDWFSTFLLAALILLVPILFVLWVNPGLLDRLQEEFSERPTPVGRLDAPRVPDAESGPARNGAEPAPEASPPSKDDYISAPRGGNESSAAAALADSEAAAARTRTAAKPVAIEETDAEASGVFDAGPATDETQDGSAPSAEDGARGDPSSSPAADPVDPTAKSPTEAPLSTAPESLAVPPAIGPTTPADADGDGDTGGLRELEEGPRTGVPTPAIQPPAPRGGAGTGQKPAPAESAAPGGTATTPAPGPVAPTTDSDVARHEEILREIRSLATSQRALEEQFAALRQEIDGRLSVLKSAVEGVAANGSSSASETGANRTARNDDPAASTPYASSPSEQDRAERAARILRATLDGKLTLELGDESGTKIDFVYVPPGRFRMGRTAAEENAAVANSVAAPAQEIVVDRGFFISRHEVSDEQFVAFLRANYADDPKLDAAIKARDDLDRPAANVSWALAKYFCLWASEESAFDVRLPTEIEWEYAARGPYGVRHPDAVSAGASAGAGEAAVATAQKARDVGEDSADRSWCGAVDFFGNVAEWCADIYDSEAYAIDEAGGAKVYSPVPAPADWVAVEAAGRSVRGGSFADPVDTRDLSERRQAKPSLAAATLGFRVVLIPDFDGESEVGEAP
jgi:formylglycine-generating enzyme required for sulfatase activity